VDCVEPFADLAWAAALLCEESRLREL
jgi:hypothetical protein